MSYVPLAIAIMYGITVTVMLFRNPLPIPDRGSRIFGCPSVEAQKAVLEVLAASGVRPRYRIDSREIKRALVDDGVTIINVTMPALHDVMRNPSSGIALVASDPMASAIDAVNRLESLGFEAEILGELDRDVPKGAMVFIATDALSGSVLVYRKPVWAMGPKPPRWTK